MHLGSDANKQDGREIGKTEEDRRGEERRGQGGVRSKRGEYQGREGRLFRHIAQEAFLS